MKDYVAKIDGGEGGETVIRAGSAAKAFHFTGDTLRDGRPIPKPGVWLKHDGPIVPCASGLHASEHPFDALTYAPGNMLHKVRLRGNITPHGNPVDKYCASERRIVATIDAECVMRSFARRVALDAVKRYWLEAPEVVVEYLKTGDETKRAAAWDAARAAAGAAARAAAGAAAGDAAGAAARAAAWAAAWAAAGAAARDAARAAARDAAWAAAEAAAWDAAKRKQRDLFKRMVNKEFKKQSELKEA